MGWERRQTPQAQLYDLPIIGGDLANVGRIIDLYATPCSPYFEIWVYGFFQAIPTLFISLTKPEFIDVDIHNSRHQKRRGKKARFRASAVYRDALIQVPVPRWAVFRVYEQFQRYGWYLLVADALENFAINWLSAAYVMNECPLPGVPYYRATADNLVLGSTNTPTNRAITWTSLAVNECNITGSQCQPIITGNYRVSYSLTWKPYGVPEQSEIPFQTGILVDGQPQEFGNPDPLPNGDSFHSLSGEFFSFGTPKATFTVFASWATPNRFAVYSGNWSVDLIQKSELGPDP